MNLSLTMSCILLCIADWLAPQQLLAWARMGSSMLLKDMPILLAWSEKQI